MNTNMAGFKWFSKILSLRPSALDGRLASALEGYL